MAPSVSDRRQRAPRLAPAERRAALVEAGIQVVARRGLEAARPSEVAEVADVSEATVYTYFPNREELVLGVLEEVGHFYSEIARRSFENDDSLEEQFAAMFEAGMSCVDTHPDHARVWFNWGSAMRDEVWPQFVEAQKKMIKPIVAGIRRAPVAERERLGLDANDLAYLALGMGETMARRKLSGASPRTIRRFVRGALGLLFSRP